MSIEKNNIINLEDSLIIDTKWIDKNYFLMKLKIIEILLRQKQKLRLYTYICNKCNYKLESYEYNLNNYKWSKLLYHLVTEHNLKPINNFINLIVNFNIKQQYVIDKTVKIKSKLYNVHKFTYTILTKNQLKILDALMIHGSHTKKYEDNKKFRYSEHSGLLDFDNTGLEKIIISAKTVRKDKYDKEIFLPENISDAIDYEYIFHTHPMTPSPGYRVKNNGILYEFPSYSDIIHFIDHYNEGITQGSIVITPEGLYNIRKKYLNNEPIIINEKKLYNEIGKNIFNIQRKAIIKYKNFDTDIFYSKIAQDRIYINKLNNLLNKYHITIDYFPRVKDKQNNWVLDTIYLPIFIIEPKNIHTHSTFKNRDIR